MTESMTDTSNANPVYRDNKFIPFTIYGEIILVGHGKRMEKYADFRKKSNQIETALNNYRIAQLYTIEFSRPTKFTFQFGNFYPKVTINGNILDNSAPKKHENDVLIIQSNEFKTGYGSANAANTVPDTLLDTAVKNLYDTIVALTSTLMTIKRIDMGGIIYGQGGRSIQ